MKRATAGFFGLRYLSQKKSLLLCSFDLTWVSERPKSSSARGQSERAEVGVEMKDNGLSGDRKPEKVKNRVAEKGLRGVIQEGAKKSFRR